MRRVDSHGWLVGRITLSYQVTKGEARGPQTPPHSLRSGDIPTAKRRDTRKDEESLTAPHGRKCGRHGTGGGQALAPLTSDALPAIWPSFAVPSPAVPWSWAVITHTALILDGFMEMFLDRD